MLRFAKQLRAVRAGSTRDARIAALGRAVVASEQALGLSPFDEQLVAAIALGGRRAVEMKTGEGKTLVAMLAAVAHASTGAHVMVLCANDYLSGRDAKWMRPAFEHAGLRVASVRPGQALDDKRAAYEADVTYVSFREATFDYLRDGLRWAPGRTVQRRRDVALIDEIDAALIDTSRVPFVIGDLLTAEARYESTLAEIIGGFVPGRDYERDTTSLRAELTDDGWARLRQALLRRDLLGPCDDLFADAHAALLQAVYQAVHAHSALERGRHYMVADGRVVLLDEATGRLAPGRRWADGLQHAVEAKERLPASPQQRARALITSRGFCAEFDHVCGMSGTLRGAASELEEHYGLETLHVPTHRPLIREDLADLEFEGDRERQAWLIDRVQARGARPMLIGCWAETVARRLSRALDEEGIAHATLTAADEAGEAEVIARAGEPGRVTVATRLAGRGTDIRLGGEDGAAYEQVVEAGGLDVVILGRGTSRRLDDQFRGRAGRQGDPGRSVVAVSLDDPGERVLRGAGVSEVRRDRAQAAAEGRAEAGRSSRHRHYSVLDQQRRAVRTRRLRLVAGAPPEGWREARVHPTRLQATAQAGARLWASAAELDDPRAFVDGAYALFGVTLPEALAEDLVRGSADAERWQRFGRCVAHALDVREAQLRDRLGQAGDAGEAAIAWLDRQRGRTPRRLVLRYARLRELQILDAAWSRHLEAFAWLADAAPSVSYIGQDPLLHLQREAHAHLSDALEAADAELARSLADTPLPLSPEHVRDIARLPGRR